MLKHMMLSQKKAAKKKKCIDVAVNERKKENMYDIIESTIVFWRLSFALVAFPQSFDKKNFNENFVQ